MSDPGTLPSAQSQPAPSTMDVLREQLYSYLNSQATMTPGLLPVTLEDAGRVSEGFNIATRVHKKSLESDETFADRLLRRVSKGIPKQAHRSLLNTCATMLKNPHTIPSEWYNSQKDYDYAQTVFTKQNEEENKDGTSTGCYDAIKNRLWLTPELLMEAGKTATASLAKRISGSQGTALTLANDWRQPVSRAWESYQSELRKYNEKLSRLPTKEQKTFKNTKPKFTAPQITTMESVYPVVNPEDRSLCMRFQIRNQGSGRTVHSDSASVMIDHPDTYHDEFAPSGIVGRSSDHPSFEEARTLTSEEQAKSDMTFNRRMWQMAANKKTHKGKKVELMSEKEPTQDEFELAMNITQAILTNPDEMMPVFTELSEHEQGTDLASLVRKLCQSVMLSEGGGTQPSAGSDERASAKSEKSSRPRSKRSRGVKSLGGTTPSMVSTAA